MAEHELTESLEVFGARPMILQRLALINMAKGDTATARTYLGALTKTFFYADWANNYLNLLESDPALSTDKKIQLLRQNRVTKDRADIPSTLADTKGHNRMAFEYSMAWYLLTKQLDKFVQNLNRMDDFDYRQIPCLYEEAILIYELITKKQADLHGRQISSRSLERYKDFMSTYARCKTDRIAIKYLVTNYYNSYFFYYFFRPPRPAI